MNAADFDTQFNRLKGQFHLNADDAERVSMEWFRALENYHVDAFDHAVTEITRTSQDRFWPPLGKVLTLIRGRIAGMPKTGKCATCHGSTWIESAPFKSNGMIYSGAVVRCPDCGIPAPQYQASNHREGLTAVEYANWRKTERQPQYMPEGLQAHPWPSTAAREAHKAEMMKAFARLRIKLFGSSNEAA